MKIIAKDIESHEFKIRQLTDLVSVSGYIHVTKGFLDHLDSDVEEIKSRFNVISEYKNSIKFANKTVKPKTK